MQPPPVRLRLSSLPCCRAESLPLEEVVEKVLINECFTRPGRNGFCRGRISCGPPCGGESQGRMICDPYKQIVSLRLFQQPLEGLASRGECPTKRPSPWAKADSVGGALSVACPPTGSVSGRKPPHLTVGLPRGRPTLKGGVKFKSGRARRPAPTQTLLPGRLQTLILSRRVSAISKDGGSISPAGADFALRPDQDRPLRYAASPLLRVRLVWRVARDAGKPPPA